jgi:phage terminase small subunit
MPRSALTPPTPATLDRTSRTIFRAVVAELRDAGTWRDTDAPAVERYVLALEDGRHARARIAARAKRDAATSRRRRKAGDEAERETAYTAAGSQGQRVAHPDVAIARDAARDAATFAGDLLLSPKARAQHRMAGVGSTAQDLELERLLSGVRS